MAPTARVYPAATAPALRGRTPAVDQFYVGGEDNLRLTLYSRVASPIRVRVTWRFWSEQHGTVQVNRDELLSVTYPTAATLLLKLEAGVLLNVRVAAVGLSGLFYGSTYVRVTVIRGFTGGVEPLATILQGYVTTDVELAWPGTPLQAMHEGPGALRSEAWTSNAGPLRATLTVPDAVRWFFVAGSVVLTTSAVAGNRVFVLTVLDAGGTFMFVGSPVDLIPASSNIRLSFGNGAAPVSNAAIANWVWTFPTNLELPQSAEVEALVVGAQAGDALDVERVAVREWMAV